MHECCYAKQQRSAPTNRRMVGNEQSANSARVYHLQAWKIDKNRAAETSETGGIGSIVPAPI